MSRIDDDRWAALNTELATGFDAQGVVLLRHGLTFEAYFTEAKRRATLPISLARVDVRERLPSNYEQNAPLPIDEESTGIADTVEIDRKKLHLGVTPFVAGHFSPPQIAKTECDDELGETSFHVRTHDEPVLPFKKPTR